MILRTLARYRNLNHPALAAAALTLAALPVTYASVRAESPAAAIERYLDGAAVVRASLDGASPDGALIAETITAMLESAKPVAVAYGGAHAQCAAQLARMIELYPDIDLWSAPEIRRNIEAAQALPPAEGCYPARDVVAHPAIVRALARLGIQPAGVERLRREMSEAVEHMEEIEAELVGE